MNGLKQGDNNMVFSQCHIITKISETVLRLKFLMYLLSTSVPPLTSKLHDVRGKVFLQGFEITEELL
jgi:hypothetical protein